MAVRRDSELAGFDADAATETALEIADDRLLVSAEYDPESFRVLYLSNRLVDEWGTTDEIMDVGEAIHAYMHDDFSERRLYDDIYPTVSETYGFVTYTDRAIIVRVLHGGAGVYFSMVRGTPVTDLVEAVKDVVDESTGTDTTES